MLSRIDGDSLADVEAINVNFEIIDDNIGAQVTEPIVAERPYLKVIGSEYKYVGSVDEFKIYAPEEDDIAPIVGMHVGPATWEVVPEASYTRKDGPVVSFRLRLVRRGANYGPISTRKPLNNTTRAGEVVANAPVEVRTNQEKVAGLVSGHAGGRGRSVSGYIDVEAGRVYLISIGPTSSVTAGDYIELMGRFLQP